MMERCNRPAWRYYPNGYAVIAWNLCDPFFVWRDRPVPGRCSIVEMAR